MTKTNLLVVEDDPGVAGLLTSYLEGRGYTVTVAASIAKMQTIFGERQPDLIILDVRLPDGNGWDALRWVRERSDLPVMMLTGNNETVDKAAGLELGADDCLGKPFSSPDLQARLHAIRTPRIRDAGRERVDRPGGTMRFHGLELDVTARHLRDETGATIKLTDAEYRILVLLACAAGEVVTREKLMEDVAGRDWNPSDRSMDVHVSNLRKKLGSGRATMIRSVRGAGYALDLAGD